MERLSAPAQSPEALQELLIAPAERARPLASTHSVLRGGRHPEGTLVLEVVLGEEGSCSSLETTVAVSSALIAWDEKEKSVLRRLRWAFSTWVPFAKRVLLSSSCAKGG